MWIYIPNFSIDKHLAVNYFKLQTYLYRIKLICGLDEKKCVMVDVATGMPKATRTQLC
jgi:hypothetical protein